MGDEPTGDATAPGGTQRVGVLSEHASLEGIDGIRLAELVGRGGMGIVHRGYHTERARPVAVKLLYGDAPDQHARERFAREARALAALHHDAIVRHVAHGITDDGRMYLVMEWLDGHDLATRLAEGPLPVHDVIRLGRRLAEGLAAAHREGIVHRDLKPSNVFLPGGSVDAAKLIDFGVARFTDGERGLTRTGGVVGTPGYMSPEQARGDALLDHRSDLFSLGCVLFECMSGQAPFRGAHLLAILAKILLEDPPRLRDLGEHIPPGLDQLVAALMAKDPGRRPARTEDVVAALSDQRLTTPSSSETAARLADREQVFLSIVFLDGLPVSDAADTSDQAIEDTVGRYSGQLVSLRDGTRMVILRGEGTPLDRAVVAVRCALDLVRDVVPAIVAVSSGQGLLSGTSLLGHVVDVGARLVQGGLPGKVVVDETTASLVADRFELTALAAGGHGVQRERHRDDATFGNRRVLGRRTPFVGRRRELAALEGLFAQVVDDCDPVLVVVTGEAGMGKSRLRRELARRLATSDDELLLLTARADPLASGAALAILGELVMAAAGVSAADDMGTRGSKLRELTSVVPSERMTRVAAFLARVAGIPFEVSSAELRAVLADPALLRDAVPEAWIEWLDAACARTPVLVIVEDLHWADVASIEILRRALRRLPSARLMILLLARPDARTRFPALWEDGMEEIPLAPLSRSAAERIVRGVLADPATSEVDRIVELAGGNPFFLEELIRASAASDDGTTPDSVLGMLQSRLLRLDARTRRLLRTASVFGERFRTEGLLVLLDEGGSEASVRQELEGLAELELIHPSSEAHDEWVFPHALVRDAAYDTLVHDDVVVAHQLAAGWLELQGDAQPSVIAQHLALGQQPARAMVWFERAAGLALESTDLRLALRWADEAIRCGAEGVALGRLRRIQTEALVLLAEWSAAIERGREALELLPEGDEDWAETCLHLIDALGRPGRFDEMDAIMTRLEGCLRPSARERGFQALCRGVTNFLRAGRVERARAFTSSTEALMEQLVTITPLTRFQHSYMHAAWADMENDPWSERQGILECIDIAERLGTTHILVEARRLRGHVETQLGANDVAERECMFALEHAENLGLRHVVFSQHAMLGLLAVRRGAIAEARTRVDRAMLLDSGDPRMKGAIVCCRATIALAEGNAERAREDGFEAYELLGATPPLLAWAHSVISRAAVALGTYAEALEHAHRALAIFEDFGTLPEFESDVAVAIVEALLAADEHDEARERIEQFVERLRQRAELIPDATYRQVFMTGVPANTRLLELHATVCKGAP